VTVRKVKAFDEPLDDAVLGRLQALRPGRSTRLGAALRLATRQLSSRQGAQRWVVLLSDGRPHDIDVHDPHYLVEDAQRAVMAASRCGTRMACVVLAPEGMADAVRIFGGRGAAAILGLSELPAAMRKLLA
jgi:nitric oxide reductase NorD protein